MVFLTDKDEIARVITQVEGCELESDNVVISKFTGSPVSISAISGGSKVILYIYYCITEGITDEIISITNCGANAIKYILENYSDYDLKLYLRHYQIPPGIKCDFKMNDILLHNTNEFYGR